MSKPKRFFNDKGNITYHDIPEDCVRDLVKALVPEVKRKEDLEHLEGVLLRKLINLGRALTLAYNLRTPAYGGDTGTRTSLEDWRKQVEDKPEVQALKTILLHFIDEGYLVAEFQLVCLNLCQRIIISSYIQFIV